LQGHGLISAQSREHFQGAESTQMETDDIKEALERAEKAGERGVGLTMAIVAVLLALATMLGHRTHTEEVVLQTRATDEWAYYQAKNNRSQMYAADARLAALFGEKGTEQATAFSTLAEQQKKGAEDVRREAEKLELETQGAAHKAKYFDISQVLLEISIVLCSITLLTRSRAFWKVSFISTLLGVILALVALLR
jgi:hypothetical protein